MSRCLFDIPSNNNFNSYTFLFSYFSDYKKFIQDQCRERSYIFQVRKCGHPNCCTPRRSDVDLPWVPDPVLNINDNQHYQEFERLLGTEASEQDKPSNQNVRPNVKAEQMQVYILFTNA